MASDKERLDVLLVEKGIVSSREKAKALIKSGNVLVGGRREDKAGIKINRLIEITVIHNPNPYVSRGGLKLEKAMAKYPIDLEGKVCMDVGASTGGFTDCMLQNGAVRVFSIDVGRDQLDRTLREDKRVVSMEKTNIRYVLPEDIDMPVAFVSIDVSFISLLKILEPVIALMDKTAQMVCLIKPQFEAGREKVGKKGVVRDSNVHEEVIFKVVNEMTRLGLKCLGLDYSPIKGPEGNIEYLLFCQKKSSFDGAQAIIPQIPMVVAEAYQTL